VKHNQRAVYVGEEEDVTANGNSIMGFNKSWKGARASRLARPVGR